MSKKDSDLFIGNTVLGLTLLAIAGVIITYSIHFPYFTWKIPKNLTVHHAADWSTTASVINGLLTPILLLASVILIWLTWISSKKEFQKNKSRVNQ